MIFCFRMSFKWTAIIFIFKYISTECHLILSITPVGKSIVSKEHSDLNLTCKVVSEEMHSECFGLTWKLPTRSSANGERISLLNQTNNELAITIRNLQEDDTGPYVCELSNKGIVRTRKITVIVRPRNCYPPFFNCGNGLCIPKHYVCDGYEDCPGGYDESFKHCGPDACHGKILCDGRCIAKELCCDPYVDINCTVNYVMPCCQKMWQPAKLELESTRCSSPVECHYNSLFGFGNSVLYIVASCAIVVMVVSSIVMFVACRVCSSRVDDFHQWPGTSDQQQQFLSGVTVPLNDIPSNSIDFDDAANLQNSITNDAEENFVLMEFVEGSGYHVAGYRPKPPPYTENVLGVPPPPYASTTSIPNEECVSSS